MTPATIYTASSAIERRRVANVQRQRRDELSDQLARELGVVARIARKAHRCVANREHFDRWEIKAVRPNATGSSYTSDENEIQALVDRYRGWYPEAEITVERVRNRNYRAGCPGDGSINPGDLYVDYSGDAGAYQSGSPYCVTCGLAVWSKS